MTTQSTEDSATQVAKFAGIPVSAGLVAAAIFPASFAIPPVVAVLALAGVVVNQKIRQRTRQSAEPVASGGES